MQETRWLLGKTSFSDQSLEFRPIARRPGAAHLFSPRVGIGITQNRQQPFLNLGVLFGREGKRVLQRIQQLPSDKLGSTLNAGCGWRGRCRSDIDSKPT